MKKVLATLSVLACLAIASVDLSAHCQVPCGIYADDVVFGELMTDVQTIEKAMGQINELSADPTKNANQLVQRISS